MINARRERTAEAAPRPFVKWAGGKSQVLPELLSRTPRHYERYFEPFLGGGALFFASSPAEAHLSDANPLLVNAYAVVRDHVEELARSLAGHLPTREYYYSMREADPSGLSDVERASWFIYLNKTCYNGLWRVNSKGRFNVPFGRYKNPRVLDEDNLRRVSRALRNAELTCADFEEALAGAGKGDFVYFDPPYHPVSRTSSFTGYLTGGFDLLQQERLAGIFAKLSDAGATAMLSNSDTTEIRRLYSGYRIEAVQAKRAINSRPDLRGAVSELVIRNY